MSRPSGAAPGPVRSRSEGRLNPLNRKVRAIVRREYLQRIRSKWFLISTFGLPLLFVGLGGLTGWLVARETGEAGAERVGVVDRTGRLGSPVVEELRQDSVDATLVPEAAEAPVDSLPGHLLASGYDLYLVLSRGDDSAAATPLPTVEVLARESLGTGARRALRDAVNRALVRVRLQDAGVEAVSPESLLREVSLSVSTVSEEGARSQELAQAMSFILAVLFYMVLIIYGQMIVRSILEEKTSDIVEVMVSSIRPWELMMGKIVGVGAVGLTQIAIWSLVVVAGAIYGLTAGAGALERAGLDLSAVTLPVGAILGGLVFLALGYLLYAGLFAGAGATLSREEDAQQVVFPIVVLIIVPFFLVQGIIESPSAGWSVIVSLVPFFSPIIMPSRLLLAAVPPWQTAASLLLLITTLLFVAWIAGRIYRVGILMKGKRPNLPELFRWVRHG